MTYDNYEGCVGWQTPLTSAGVTVAVTTTKPDWASHPGLTALRGCHMRDLAAETVATTLHHSRCLRGSHFHKEVGKLKSWTGICLIELNC